MNLCWCRNNSEPSQRLLGLYMVESTQHAAAHVLSDLRLHFTDHLVFDYAASYLLSLLEAFIVT